ncbi:hypothetical protein [Bacillus xiapuensis]|nr:hypothetical protein [Bacillus xiapuensis]
METSVIIQGDYASRYGFPSNEREAVARKTNAAAGLTAAACY